MNGDLFEADYNWKHHPAEIPNTLFRNTGKNKAGDTGTDILDVFDRYNFTINEDEPLEKEVACVELTTDEHKLFNGNKMPTISTFYGIIIRMFFEEHAPPH